MTETSRQATAKSDLGFEVKGDVIKWTVGPDGREVQIDGQSIEVHSMTKLPSGDVLAIKGYHGSIVNLSKAEYLKHYYGYRDTGFTGYSLVTMRDGRVLAHAHPHSDRDPMVLNTETGDAVSVRAESASLSNAAQVAQASDGYTYAVMRDVYNKHYLVCLDTAEVVRTPDGREITGTAVTLGVAQAGGQLCAHDYSSPSYILEAGKALVPSRQQAAGGVVLMPSVGSREGNRIMGTSPANWPIAMIVPE